MKIEIQRIGKTPIIAPHMDQRMGANVNGPSLIEVPDWIEAPLGRLYLYFAHHDGRYIRLAFADDIAGPWRMHEAGVLPLADSLFRGHIASPDVHVDHQAKCIRMYFHGADEPSGREGVQSTRVAVSSDGLAFAARPEVLGNPYMRVVRYRDWYLAMAMPGVFYRSRDGLTDFEVGPTLFDANMRHAALMVRDDRLWVFYSQVGDVPERILVSEIDLSADWQNWQTTAPTVVLEPETDYEGADLPLRPSVRGLADQPVRELRDPCVFRDSTGSFLLYSVAGESGIGLARFSVRA